MDNQEINLSFKIESSVEEICEKVTQGMKSRGYEAANELRNSSQKILRGQRHGREYIVPGTGRVKYNKRKKTATITYKKYRASAPGEPPAVRTGAFRGSWQTQMEVANDGSNNVSVKSYIESSTRTDNGKYLLGEVLEEGTSRMSPRPYQEKIQEDALPKILRIYKRPYV